MEDYEGSRGREHVRPTGTRPALRSGSTSISVGSRVLATVLALGTLLAAGCGSNVSMDSTTNASAGPWGDRADRAMEMFIATDAGNEGAHAYAYMAGAKAMRSGWGDPQVLSYLDAVYSTQNPDGGYGLSHAFDAFQDGSENGPETTYLVTVTDHVGRVFLDGWQAGAVPRERVEELVDVTLATPRVPGGPGICLAYSTVPDDGKVCVHNVSAGAGWFLAEADRLGIKREGLLKLVDAITLREVSSFDAESGWWEYIEGSAAPNDWNHQAYNAEAVWYLDRDTGERAMDALFAQREPLKWVDPLGQIRLLPWACERSDEFLEAFDSMLEHEDQSPRLLAQFAYWAARVADRCG